MKKNRISAVQKSYTKVPSKAIEIGPLIQTTFEKAYKAGVKIAFRTDAGVFADGKNAKEFEYMTEVGMPAMEAVKAATAVPAEILGEQNNMGSITKANMLISLPPTKIRSKISKHSKTSFL
ncbi:amidohydrolase family protein [Runella slithyformis]|uniref:amidohydrolase family protein n=1 Tax=Runella slithyformis TaxID=106 RepID=UPI000302F988|nr:amidohydrolase family protein [Runella slithyformis]